MARLTSLARKSLASSTFALPGRKYPIPDKSHARNALARASQYATPSEKATIRRKVAAKFPEIQQENSLKQFAKGDGNE